MNVDRTHPFQDPDLPMEDRITNILSLLTIQEKISCLGTNPSVPRLGIKGADHVEGLHGLAMGEPGGWGRNHPVPTTQFPQAYGMGQTWDPELVRRAAAIEGLETRWIFQSPKYGYGGLVVRAPNADLGRDPRWGRTEECFGEDPHLTGVMAEAVTRGLQGDDPRYWLTASLLKHFLANSNENGRDHSSSDFSEALWREYYSATFRRAIVQGGSRCYMTAYNAVNGVPCIVNNVIRDVTMKEWGLDGIVCTDGGAFTLLVKKHRWYADGPSGAAACVRAGIGQFLDRHAGAVAAALDSGLLQEREIDDVLRGVFRVMIRLGLLDPEERVPYSSIGKTGEDPWMSEEHRAVARKMAEESIVLLKNGDGLLPLDPRKVRSIAVIGPRAEEVLFDWYSGTPPYAVSPLEGIRARAGSSIAVSFTRGDREKQAAEAAKAADVAIVCVGNHPTAGTRFGVPGLPGEGKEAVDRESLDLEQEALVRAVMGANPRTVCVLVSSFPYAIIWTAHNVPAIIHTTHNCQELGNALASVLFGDVSPAGRLVQTWPRSLSQLPPMMDYDITAGRTYMYFKGEPLFPFGHGLSYTRFTYLDMSVTPSAAGLEVVVTVENSGERDGEEVVQIYLRRPDAAAGQPRIRLVGFRRAAIKRGERASLSFQLGAEELSRWDAIRRGFAVVLGKVEILAGASSADIRLSRTAEIKGPHLGT